ncbi:MAG: MFS transporter, partial [Ilumatobacteraceae bacterium]
MSAAPEDGRFEWDRLTVATVFGYCTLVCAQSVGIVYGELREEFAISGVITALHGGTFGASLLVLGTFGVALVDRIGRRATIATSFALIAVGVAVFCTGRSWPFTLAGAATAGLGGATWVMVIPGIISDHHGPNRAQAFSSVNGLPVIAGFAFSLAIGGSLALDHGWRVPYATLSTAIVVVAVVIASGVRLPDAPRHGQFTLRHFASRAVLVPWAQIVNLVLVEYTVGIWAATYLREVGGASPGAAPVLAMVFGLTLFAIRMVTDRVVALVGGWAIPLSLVVLGGSVAGFCLVGPLWARVVLLGIAGLGAGPLYPLG